MVGCDVSWFAQPRRFVGWGQVLDAAPVFGYHGRLADWLVGYLAWPVFGSEFAIIYIALRPS